MRLLPFFYSGFRVNKITNRKPVKRGELYYSGKIFIYKGLLFEQSLKLDDLTTIKGYYYVPPSLEEVCCIDFIFSNRKKILFVGTRADHLEFINMILVNELNLNPLHFNKTLVFDNDEGKNYQTIYLKKQ